MWTNWLKYIDNLTVFNGNTSEKIVLSLDRVQKMAKQLDLQTLSAFIITVTGTNGKGSTSRLIETVLLEHGYNVGVFSSPQLLDFRELLRVNDQILSQDQFIQAFNVIKNHLTVDVTPFEFSFLSVLYLLKQIDLDFILLEVGMGGINDVTNIINNDISVITNIALDHMKFLGNTREQIGANKAGIFREGKLAIIGEYDLPSSVLNYARQKNTKLDIKGKHWNFTTNQDLTWNWFNDTVTYSRLPQGKLLIDNLATSIAVLNKIPIKIDQEKLVSCIRNTSLMGRFQIITPQQLQKVNIFKHAKKYPHIIADVAHNPAGAEKLATSLQPLLQKKQKIIAICGILKDKDMQGILQPLLPLISSWFLISLANERGQTASELFAFIQKAELNIANNKIQISNDIITALKSALLEADQETYILVFGSFHTVKLLFNLIYDN